MSDAQNVSHVSFENEVEIRRALPDSELYGLRSYSIKAFSTRLKRVAIAKINATFTNREGLLCSSPRIKVPGFYSHKQGH